MSNQEIQRRRNEATRYIDLGDRGRLNSIRFGENESEAHFKEKCDQCWKLNLQGKHFYTEARFASPFKGRADILNLDDWEILEIMDSEDEHSIEVKKKTYPPAFHIWTVKA
jgi:hypothetical protein